MSIERRNEIELTVALTAAKLDRELMVKLGELREEIRKDMKEDRKSFYKKIESCRRDHDRSRQWGISTWIAAAAFGVAMASFFTSCGI